MHICKHFFFFSVIYFVVSCMILRASKLMWCLQFSVKLYYFLSHYKQYNSTQGNFLSCFSISGLNHPNKRSLWQKKLNFRNYQSHFTTEKVVTLSQITYGKLTHELAHIHITAMGFSLSFTGF